MRQLKGKVKETRKQKQERRIENQKIQQQVKTIALPACGIIFVLIAIYVYLKTRPIKELMD